MRPPAAPPAPVGRGACWIALHHSDRLRLDALSGPLLATGRKGTRWLLGEDFDIVAKDKLYDCHDKLLEHKRPLFTHLQERRKDLFGARFEVLLYDLTSTYFESEPRGPDTGDKRRFGYSRDKRGDCVQVVIALVTTPEGFPSATR